MKISVGVLTHNALSTMRFGLLERTIISLKKAFPTSSLLIFDNNSTDGSDEAVLEMGGVHYTDGNGRPGTGRIGMMNVMHAPGDPPDVIVFSDDDMEWREGAEEKVLDIWSQAPSDLLIVSGLLEPVWHWNTPRETVKCSQTNVLVRDSCPGAAWTFRSADWGLIKRHMVKDFGYDHKACVGARADGYRVAQVDLAEHIGWGCSTHGNDANQHLDARPLDRARWGV